MKKWFILIGILAVLFVGGYVVLSFYAVKFIQPQLQKVMGPGLTLAEIKVKLTYLSVRGMRYEDPIQNKNSSKSRKWEERVDYYDGN